MQTFLPYFDPERVARILDDKRLRAQLKEGAQIDAAIHNHLNRIEIGYCYHPATLMWYEYRPALRWYRYYLGVEYQRRFGSQHKNTPELPDTFDLPWWWGDDRITTSHRRALWRKLPSHYPRKWAGAGDYFWPVGEAVMEYPRQQVMLFPPGEDGCPDFGEIPYPRFSSPKLDGSFCLVFQGGLFSRRCKPLPNSHLYTRLQPLLDLSLDRGLVLMGELYDPTEEVAAGIGLVRAHASDIGETGIYLFDCIGYDDWKRGTGGLRFEVRYRILENLPEIPYVSVIPQTLVRSAAEAQALFEDALQMGYEGTVTRDPNAYYKHGRCTARERNLFRHTENVRLDAIIIGVSQGKKLKEGVDTGVLLSGLKARTHEGDNYEPDEIAGALLVRDEQGREFKVGFGHGWTLEMRRELWANRDNILRRVVEIKAKRFGEKENPRQPKLVRFRDDKVLS
jgi:hypothetical protein